MNILALVLISAFAISLADVALAMETRSTGMVVASGMLALLAAALMLRQRRAATDSAQPFTTAVKPR